MYITRDENNNIIAAFANLQYDNQEWLDDGDTALQAFLNPVPAVNINLYQADNTYISYIRSLNTQYNVSLPDKASREDIQNFLDTAAANNTMDKITALEIGLQSIALVNDVVQNGGSWINISWHDNI